MRMGTGAAAGGPAHGNDVAFDSGVVDIGIRPYLLKQLILRDESISVDNQMGQDRIGFRRERNQPAGLRQLLRFRIQFVVAEKISH